MSSISPRKPDSNFAKVKRVLNSLDKISPLLSSVEYAFVIHLLTQQYRYIRNGKAKDGDYIGYKHIAKSLNISKTSAQNAIRRLTSKGIILKSPGNQYGNHYSFNETYFKGQQGYTIIGLYFGMLKREVGNFGDRLVDYIWGHNPFLMVINMIGGN